MRVNLWVLLGGGVMVGAGYIPTHDGEYHIIRFMEFWKMLASGYFFPRWAPGLNSGFGFPLFNFHYPLPNYIGAFWHLWGFDFITSFKLTLASGYLLATFFCFFWLKKLFGVWPAVVGTIVAAYTPYWFVDLYVRGVVGEVWALTFVFACLAAIEYKKSIALSLCVAGLILSHNILALLFLPFLIGYIFISNFEHFKLIKNFKFQISNCLPIFLGIALSSYFWLPALAERSFMKGLNTVTYSDHFAELYELLIPSWGSGFSASGMANKMSFQIGIVPLLCVILTSWSLWRERITTHKRIIKYFLLVLFLAVFLTLSVSKPIWQVFPIVQYSQYPWRFLSFVIIAAAASSAAAASAVKLNPLSLLLPVAAIILAFPYSRPAIYEPRGDSYYLNRRDLTDGTSSMGNSFNTVWSGWKQTRAKELISLISGSGKVNIVTDKYLEKKAEITAETEITCEANITYYPGWTVYANGKELTLDYKTNGTLRFSLPPSVNSVSIIFQETSLRLFANVVSLLSLLSLLSLIIFKPKF